MINNAATSVVVTTIAVVVARKPDTTHGAGRRLSVGVAARVPGTRDAYFILYNRRSVKKTHIVLAGDSETVVGLGGL